MGFFPSECPFFLDVLAKGARRGGGVSALDKRFTFHLVAVHVDAFASSLKLHAPT